MSDKKKIEELKIKEFLNDVGSNSPTPGGGAVAAVMGAMAASLVEMVCNLTIGKKGYKKNEEEIKKIKEISVKYKEELLGLADGDINAFNNVIDAYRMEKNNPKRNVVIQDALKEATRVPLETARLSKKNEDMAEKMIEKGNKNALSDARTAKYLADAAVKSALENVDINMQLIEDNEWKKKILPLIAELK